MAYKIFLFLLLPMLSFCAAKISIIVPCYVTHVPYLENLLSCYANQTRLPDEVVISVSSADVNAIEIIDELKSKSYPFSLNIVSTKEKQSAGKNRNIACSLSKGELLICQDADDIPHPQRVEIIGYFYENVGFDLLLHSYMGTSTSSFHEKILNKFYNIHYKFDPALNHYILEGASTNQEFNTILLNPNIVAHVLVTNPKFIDFFGNAFPIVQGCPAITRKVFDKVKWTEGFKTGEDIEFHERVRTQFKRTLIIRAKLYYYANWASTFNN